MRRILIFILILFSLAHAQEGEYEKPSLTVRAIGISAKHRIAIVSTDERTLAVEQGDELGDFLVKEVTPSGMVLEYDGETFSYTCSRLPPRDPVFDPRRRITETVKDETVKSVVARLAMKAGAGALIPIAPGDEISTSFQRQTLQSAITQALSVEEWDGLGAIWSGQNLIVAPPRALSRMPVDLLEPKSKSDEFLLESPGIDLVPILRMIATMTEQNLYLTPGVRGDVWASLGSASLKGATQAILGLEKYETFAVTEQDNFQLVAPHDFEWKPAPTPASSKSTKLDFVNADLGYVVIVLAHLELGRNVVSKPIRGAVTITMSEAAPTTTLLHLALHGQEFDHLEYQLTDNFFVHPRVELNASPAGPTVTYQPEEEYLEENVEDVVGVIAEALGLKTEMPQELAEQTVLINLKDAPAHQSLELVLGVHGYTSTIEDGTIKITKREKTS